jgi:hypothetical protein
MTTKTKTTRNPDIPQWVRDTYRAEDIQPHAVILSGSDEAGWLVRTPDFTQVNLYNMSLTEKTYHLLSGTDVLHQGDLADVIRELQENTGTTVLFSEDVLDLAQEIHPGLYVFSTSSQLVEHSMVRWDYDTFLKAYKAYEKEPNEIGTVYDFLNYHPMFWRYEQGPTGRDGVTRPPLLVTDRGWSVIDLMVARKKNKKTKEVETTVMLEAGAASKYANRYYMYHDYNLDVYEKSLDAAYIKLAKYIHEDYDEHGVLRNGEDEPNRVFKKRD